MPVRPEHFTAFRVVLFVRCVEHDKFSPFAPSENVSDLQLGGDTVVEAAVPGSLAQCIWFHNGNRQAQWSWR